MADVREMKALVYRKAGRRFGEVTMVPCPVCGDGQVVIKVMACGICKWCELSHDTPGESEKPLSRYPVIPGHEFAGVIAEVGRDVRGYAVGDRVTADNTVPCGGCYQCQRGNTLYCEHFGSLGNNINGGFAQYVAVDAAHLFKIPDHVSFEEASMTEAVACCVHAIKAADIRLGQTVVVLGAGLQGILLSQLAVHSNALETIAIDIEPGKLALLEKYGVKTVLASPADTAVHEKALEALAPHGVDLVIDTAGVWPMMKSLFKFLKKGGKYMQYGSFHARETLDITTDMLNDIHFKEQRFIGVSAQTNCFPEAVDYISGGKLDLKPLITHRFPLDRYFEALDVNRDDPTAIKVVIFPDEA
ncbi:alcohol dehydrogenase catalytic domain-containing protein [uncultured Oscillibacter sp.]|uniref:alcohol dehydrogenase catalytic domain-containing protein n=1 Tax=uncultured Oscillibacter sp. TaxID=876091 RepID=UPI00262BF5FA|nr:alcohol dehydrogenase catalytic domain-containing protein [uncultured Oscillibacter sp.]